MAQDGPWFNAAIGSCDAPTFTSEVTAGQTVLLVSGGLMAGTPLNSSITPYGETSRPPWWSIDQTTYADANGNVCVEAFATAVDDFGTFLMTVHGLDASQRQYNPPSLGFTVRPPAQPTETPEPTASPTPTQTPTSTPTPTPAESPTPEPTVTVTPLPSETPGSTPSVTPTLTPTDLPTTTPEPSPTPDSTEPPAPAPTEPAPTQTTEPPAPATLEPVPTEPSEPLIQYQAPEVTVPPTAAPTSVAHPTTATSQATRASVPASAWMERLFESKLAAQETWQAARQVAIRHSPPNQPSRANQADARESLTSPAPVNPAESPVVAQVKAPTKDEPLSPASDSTPVGNHVGWLIALGAVAMLLVWTFGYARR